LSQFEQRQWQIVEKQFFPEQLNHYETLFTVGNGSLGIRGTFEEGYSNDNPAIFVGGIFNQYEDEIPELISLPNPLHLNIEINNSRFRQDEGIIVGYKRTLDLKTAILTREILWLSPNQDLIKLQFERFASIVQPNLLCIKASITPLSEGSHTITISSSIDAGFPNSDQIEHWQNIQKDVLDKIIQIRAQTSDGKYRCSISSSLQIDYEKFATVKATYSEDALTQTAHVNLSQYETTSVIKYNVIVADKISQSTETISHAILIATLKSNYDNTKRQHILHWDALWKQADIVVKGDEIAQRALRFCIYHLLIAAPHNNENISIGAKSLSGYGYKGHVFWDTELFMLPLFTLNFPDVAKNLLMYRYHNLEGARDKARSLGYEGSMFPWESADTGYETTPTWVTGDVSGKLIRIWTGENEQHISSDIAYAVNQYWQWSGDDAWMVNYGAEIVLDTANFWESRVEYKDESEHFELTKQIGPDEYHENINNPAYTNYLVKWHLAKAINIFSWMQRKYPEIAKSLAMKLKITPEKLSRWQQISAKMYIPTHNNILEQFDGFFNLPRIPIEQFTPRTANLYWTLGPEAVQELQVIKQADVVMLLALLGKQLGNEDYLQKNWQVYANLVDHGSSLSSAVYAWVEAKLGHTERAYEDWLHAALTDIDNVKGNTDAGIHAACCGGVWQAVIFGFCGLEIRDGNLAVQPKLPPHWESVSFNVNFRGKNHHIVLTQASTDIQDTVV